jgi:dolichyl-phosphate-mannose-protein mannosyltransferase
MTLLDRALKRPLVALAIIASVAGTVRFIHLGEPAGRIFDEAYYSKDGCLYAGYSLKECDLTKDYWVVQRADDRGETSWVHPQLGKWMIAAGILGEGNSAFGWRVSAAAAGTAIAVMVGAIVWLLFGSILWTYVGGLLITTETLNFVQSRVSMLDVFLEFWVVLGFLLLLLDRRWIERRRVPVPDPPAPPPPALSPGPGAMALHESLAGAPALERTAVPSPIWRPWRFAAGFALGCACATKWSGALALLAAGLLALFWEITRRKRAGYTAGAAVWGTIKMELLGGLLAFVFLPIAVYLVSYTRYFVFQSWHHFFNMQAASWDFHANDLPYTKLVDGKITNTHPYESKPWTWLAMLRPVSYYFKGPGTEVLAMGHPLLFWGSVFTLPYVGWCWLRRRDWRAGFIVVPALVMYLPWFLKASEVQFFFYILPVTPFLVLAAVYALRELSKVRVVRSREGEDADESVVRPFVPVAITYVVVYLLLFAFFYPVLTGWHLSYNAWHYRMWMPSWI